MSSGDPVRNPGGTLTVPGRAEGPDGTIGDGMITIGPDDPAYPAWDRYLARAEMLSAVPGDVEEQAGGHGPGEAGGESRTITAQLAAGGRGIGLAAGYDLNPRSGMISLDLPPGAIAPVPGGVDSHHVTVVYLGPDVDDEAFAQAQDRARAAASAMPGPLAGTAGGIGTFPPSGSSDEKTPVWAGVVLPGAEQLRGSLADLSASEHPDWKPHVTLAFTEPGEGLPAPVPPTPVSFTHLSVHRGDDVARFPLGGIEPDGAREPAEPE